MQRSRTGFGAVSQQFNNNNENSQLQSQNSSAYNREFSKTKAAFETANKHNNN
jgi:hypothetical protein